MKLTGRLLSFLLFVSLLLLLFSACTNERHISYKRVKVIDYPADTPFVYNNKIVLQGKLSKDVTKNFTNTLPNYWDDSLQALKQQVVVIFYRIKNPPIFDSVNISKSVQFMRAYLKSQGYFYSSFRDKIDTAYVKGQRLVTVTMYVTPGTPTIIDSVSYGLKDTMLQALAKKWERGSLLKPHKSYFAKDLIANELDRLVNIYRNSGYFLLTRDNLIAEADTSDLRFAKDSLERAHMMADTSAKKRWPPTCSIIIKLRPNADSLKAYDSAKSTRVYYTGNIYYYPETTISQNPDSLLKDSSQFRAISYNDSLRRITMYYNTGKFVLQPLKYHTYLNFGKPYDEYKFYKTVNSLSLIGAWQQVDSRSHIDNDTVDFHIFLVPTIKQNFSIDLEASRNTGDFLTSNNLFGLTVNTTYRDRDVWQRAIQSTTTLSNGVELSFEPDIPLLQTIQSSLGHTYTFPRILPPFTLLEKLWDKKNNWENKRTFFSLNAAYTDRSDFFILKSFVANTGIQFKNKNLVWQITPVNIELYSLDTLPLLDTAFITNPFLRTAFNTGSVMSLQVNLSTTFPDRRHSGISNYISAGVEWTYLGTIITDIAKVPNLYQFAKEQAQWVRTYNLRHTQLAMRFAEGFGVNYSGSSRFGITMPFFKQFAEGGPNSMRGWALRQLGLGSSLLSDTASSTFRDRYGDMELEYNFEYRFPIATIGGVNINSCFFTDMGNVWNVRNDPNNPNGTFALNTLGHDVAIAVGTGIRLDFSYFLIRVDFGLKLKDPARLENNGWLDVSHFSWRNDEFNVKDAVTGEPIPQDNYAFQLGIGLPF